MQGGTPPLQLFTGSPHASVTFSDRLRKPSKASHIYFLSSLCLQRLSSFLSIFFLFCPSVYSLYHPSSLASLFFCLQPFSFFLSIFSSSIYDLFTPSSPSFPFLSTTIFFLQSPSFPLRSTVFSFLSIFSFSVYISFPPLNFLCCLQPFSSPCPCPISSSPPFFSLT